MLITCHKCKYIWNYKGQSKYYASCPMCVRKVDIKKQEVDQNPVNK